MSKRLKIVAGVLVAVVAISGLGVALGLRQLEPGLRAWVITTLSESLQSEVQLGTVRLHWLPFRLEARNLTVRHRGRTDIPPLLVVASFTADLSLTKLWSSTVDRVTVDGMEIHIPPKDAATGKRPLPKPQGGNGSGAPLLIRRLTATNTRLSIIPRTEGKNPKAWDIFELEILDLGAGSASPFRAELTNPLPHGTIEAAGRFGPWDSNEPGVSPLSGEYTFAADLGTIKGLKGQLSAIGTMTGVLEQVATTGETQTPDFMVTALNGRSLPLTTTYDAIVDGTRGDVDLTRVDLVLGTSPLHATGVVEGTKGIRGKRITLKITSTKVSLAELLRFSSRAEPPMASGTVALNAAFDLPQGDADVLDRLTLRGTFRAGRLRFSNDDVQEKIDQLSRRAQGRPDDESIDNVASNLTSAFTLSEGVLSYRGLAFAVQGAAVKLDGTHNLESKQLALVGDIRLTASASSTLTGFKRWLLKPLDPLFRQQGAGTRLVIHVEGTQDHPKVDLQLAKTLRGR